MRALHIAVLCLSLFAGNAMAQDYVITVKDHQFSPAQLEIPADQKVKVTIKNQDTSAMEFESYDLKREKVIGGNSEAVLFVGPLSAGTYNYFDDFHKDSKASIVVK